MGLGSVSGSTSGLHPESWSSNLHRSTSLNKYKEMKNIVDNQSQEEYIIEVPPLSPPSSPSFLPTGERGFPFLDHHNHYLPIGVNGSYTDCDCNFGLPCTQLEYNDKLELVKVIR